mmetsp:Transcript_80050/g.183390  ORF Transcript_80050/g.183390 Transcript_80050/m.183390 type:complete len:780 (+) Transcript_80050:21-2360(+)
MDDYHVIKKLGEGAFGEVVKASHKSSGQVVAIKQIKKVFRSWDECLKLKELASLRKLKHDNIVALKEAFRHQLDGYLYFVFEFVDNNLMQIAAKAGPMSEADVAFWMKQLCRGVSYMHTNGYFHRDIKPENILVECTDRTVKIADFGLAREIRSRPPYTDYIATRWYRAPECLLKTNRYSSPIDLWACGAIMGELAAGRPLFPGSSSIDTLNKICKLCGSPNPSVWPEGVALASKMGFLIKPVYPNSLGDAFGRASPEFLELLQGLLNINPQRRPSARLALNSGYLAQVAVPGAKAPSAAATPRAVTPTPEPASEDQFVDSPKAIKRPPKKIDEDESWLMSLEGKLADLSGSAAGKPSPAKPAARETAAARRPPRLDEDDAFLEGLDGLLGACDPSPPAAAASACPAIGKVDLEAALELIDAAPAGNGLGGVNLLGSVDAALDGLMQMVASPSHGSANGSAEISGLEGIQPPLSAHLPDAGIAVPAGPASAQGRLGASDVPFGGATAAPPAPDAEEPPPSVMVPQLSESPQLSKPKPALTGSSSSMSFAPPRRSTDPNEESDGVWVAQAENLSAMYPLGRTHAPGKRQIALLGARNKQPVVESDTDSDDIPTLPESSYVSESSLTVDKENGNGLEVPFSGAGMFQKPRGRAGSKDSSACPSDHDDTATTRQPPAAASWTVDELKALKRAVSTKLRSAQGNGRATPSSSGAPGTRRLKMGSDDAEALWTEVSEAVGKPIKECRKVYSELRSERARKSGGKPPRPPSATRSKDSASALAAS